MFARKAFLWRCQLPHQEHLGQEQGSTGEARVFSSMLVLTLPLFVQCSVFFANKLWKASHSPATWGLCCSAERWKETNAKPILVQGDGTESKRSDPLCGCCFWQGTRLFKTLNVHQEQPRLLAAPGPRAEPLLLRPQLLTKSSSGLIRYQPIMIWLRRMLCLFMLLQLPFLVWEVFWKKADLFLFKKTWEFAFWMLADHSTSNYVVLSFLGSSFLSHPAIAKHLS